MRLAFVTLALVWTGCALGGGPVPLEPHLDGFVPPDVPSTLPTLGVADFEDRRPETSRRAFSPRLGLVRWGVGVVGEAQTGDGSFVGRVDDGVRADAIATLMRSGAFSDVRPLEDWGGRVPDYTLLGTLEELVALQHRSTRLDVATIGFFRRSVDDAIGIVRVRFELYRGDALVWADLVETWLRVPDAPLERALLDALAVTHERLAHRLHATTRPRIPELSRPLPVRVIDGCGLGAKHAKRLVDDGSEILEREMDVRLVPRIETGSPSARVPSLERALADVSRLEPPAKGVVLALVPDPTRRGLRAPTRFGLARGLGRHAVVACRAPARVRPLTIAHEIAHLFGAVHVRDRSSVMHAVAEFDARFFDGLNRRILRAMRLREFDAPLAAAQASALEALYREAAASPDAVHVPDLERALSTVQSRLLAR